jgi:penicillin-binding protein 2
VSGLVAPSKLNRPTLFWCFVSGIVFLWVAFCARLIWLQVFEQTKLSQAAENNRSLRVIQRAPRGIILDRKDRNLASNELWYSQPFIENGKQLEKRLEQEEALALMATSPAQVRKNYSRSYPYGPITAQVVGYVQQPKISQDVVVGKAGLERQYNARLAGSDGVVVFEKNARGQAVRILSQQEPIPGLPVRLTVDGELSKEAFLALGQEKGAVIVSRPKTGEILAAVSTPSFVPLQEKNGVWDDWVKQGSVAESLVSALDFPGNPFLFRPLGALYPPGSTFKIVTALAGLELDAIEEDTQVLDEGKITVGEFSYENWYWRAYGRVEGEIGVVRALARSNDIFFYKVAEWLGPDQLAKFARLFSYGSATGADISGEKSGIMPDPVWKQQYFGEKWYLGNTYHMGIGQGDVLVTPMQVQTMTSAVVAKGRKCAPRFVQGEPLSCQELALDPESLDLVWQGMREACAPGGTAFPFFTTSYDILCKTGTAEYGAANEEGHRPTHAWFTAAVSRQPREGAQSRDDFEPEIVVTVLVESSEEQIFAEGSTEAAPIAKRVIDWWLANGELQE